MGGFLGGVLAGLVVVVGAGAFLSMTAPPPQPPEVDSATPEAATPTEQAGDGGAALTATGRDADLVELAPRAPDARAEQGDSLAALEDADTSPADKPRVGAATGALERPAEGEGARITVESDAPVAPEAPAAVQNSPESESRPDVETAQPAPPAAPDATADGGGFAAPRSEESGPRPSSLPDPAVDQEDSAAASMPRAEARPEVDTSPAEAPVAEEPAVQEPAVARLAPEAETDAPQMAALPQVGDETAVANRPSIGTPIVPLTERDKVPDLARDPEVKPIEAHAAPFDNPEDKPLMSIVLIDDAESLGAEALAE
ncbi:hypothetical protein AB9K41_13270, partial [Cribrihabitans sp. XS_ASV171]